MFSPLSIGNRFRKKYDNMDWISVKERMPNDGERVLVWNNKQGEPTLQVYNKDYECWDTEDGDDFDFQVGAVCGNGEKIVEYWMPLPEKPNKQ